MLVNCLLSTIGRMMNRILSPDNDACPDSGKFGPTVEVFDQNVSLVVYPANILRHKKASLWILTDPIVAGWTTGVFVCMAEMTENEGGSFKLCSWLATYIELLARRGRKA